jgi:ribosome-binding protein aMBF1 (putative translation factor)
MAMLERTDDIVKPKTLTREQRLALQQARISAGFKNVKEFAHATNLDESMIKGWENGTSKELPKDKDWNVMENKTNVKLRGKDIGKPKFVRKEKAGETAAKK